MKLTDKDIARFWSKVNKAGDDECWEWTGGCRNGYGRFVLRWCQTYAHRISWELAFGEIPKGLCALHKCDNPPCVNPKHLFLGTKKDNTDDMIKKGRHVVLYGEETWNCKLTDAQVVEIRRRYGRLGIDGETSGALAKEFGISSQYVLDLVHNVWRSQS